MFSILMVLLSADVDVTVSVATGSIRQCDPLIVKAAVKYLGRDLLAIKDRDPPCDNRVRYEYRAKGRDEWLPLPALSRFGTFSGLPSGYETDEIILWEKGVWAEFDVILLSDQDEFIFASPGQFEVRAVVEAATRKRPVAATISAPVAVTVESRPAKDILRIRKARQVVHLASGIRWLGKVPAELRELHDVGGALGRNVKDLLLIERITSGAEPVGHDVLSFLQERLNGMELEIARLRLADYYRQQQDHKRLAKILYGMEQQTLLGSEWNLFLELKPRRGYDPSKYKPLESPIPNP